MSAFGSDKHGSVAFVDRSPSLLERCEGSKGENSIAFASRVSGETKADLLSPSGASGERGGSIHGIPNCKYGSVAFVDRSLSPLERCEGDKGEASITSLRVAAQPHTSLFAFDNLARRSVDGSGSDRDSHQRASDGVTTDGVTNVGGNADRGGSVTFQSHTSQGEHSMSLSTLETVARRSVECSGSDRDSHQRVSDGVTTDGGTCVGGSTDRINFENFEPYYPPIEIEGQFIWRRSDGYVLKRTPFGGYTPAGYVRESVTSKFEPVTFLPASARGCVENHGISFGGARDEAADEKSTIHIHVQWSRFRACERASERSAVAPIAPVHCPTIPTAPARALSLTLCTLTRHAAETERHATAGQAKHERGAK